MKKSAERKKAEQISAYLFTNVYGDKCGQLRLCETTKPDSREFGGYAEKPMADMIEDFLTGKLPAKKARRKCL